MKAYDLKKLGEKLKEEGVELLEENIKVLLPIVMDWVSESAIASENKFDDVLAGIIPAVKPYIMEQVEKINSED